MSVAVTYTLIVIAFLAVFAMCIEISVRNRRSEQATRPLREGRRVDRDSVPRGPFRRPAQVRRDSLLPR